MKIKLDSDPKREWNVRPDKQARRLMETNKSMGLGTEAAGNLFSLRVIRRMGILPREHVRF